MAVEENLWRPSAMQVSETKGDSPSGFSSIRLVGNRMSMDILEPISINSQEDWNSVIVDLDFWGNVPDPNFLEIISQLSNERGLLVKIKSSEIEWLAEFLPWGSDNRIESRVVNSQLSVDKPCGGYRWKEQDIIILRKIKNYQSNSNDDLIQALSEGDKELAIDILYNSGKSLGFYHSSVESFRETPMDQKRWNKRLLDLEEKLSANTIWRAPFSRKATCMLSLGDVRFSDILISEGNEYFLRISPPRLADGLYKPVCEFPAIRDLSCLVQDLGRLFHKTKSPLDITDLRKSLIEGWIDNAPSSWSSSDVFYAHKGGLAIWEYEQSLLDVLESTANQSGPPSPAVQIISKVIPFQKSMYNSRTIAALSFISIFLGISTVINNPPTSFSDTIIPSFCIILGYFTHSFYRKLSPPPEKPITDL